MDSFYFDTESAIQLITYLLERRGCIGCGSLE